MSDPQHQRVLKARERQLFYASREGTQYAVPKQGISSAISQMRAMGTGRKLTFHRRIEWRIAPGCCASLELHRSSTDVGKS